MEVSPLHHSCCTWLPIRSRAASISSRRIPRVSSGSTRRRNVCLASFSSETLIGSRKEDGKRRKAVNERDEAEDLKEWMHKNGLPPCKIVLKERTSYDEKHIAIHYVAASEDLEVGDVAFSVPNSLVVTLKRVFGDVLPVSLLLLL